MKSSSQTRGGKRMLVLPAPHSSELTIAAEGLFQLVGLTL